VPSISTNVTVTSSTISCNDTVKRLVTGLGYNALFELLAHSSLAVVVVASIVLVNAAVVTITVICSSSYRTGEP
jgi:hypothetical protein